MVNSKIFVNSPNNFRNFPEILIIAIYVKNFQNYIQGDFIKIREYTQVIILRFSLKYENTALKMKALKFQGIQPINKSLYIDAINICSEPGNRGTWKGLKSEADHPQRECEVICELPSV